VVLLLLWRQRWLWRKRYLLRRLLLLLLLRLLRWLLLLWCKVNMQLLLLRWWLMMRWQIRKQLLWRWLDVNHLMTPVVVSMTERCSCLKHNTHDG
jgi:hypothetical protein